MRFNDNFQGFLVTQGGILSMKYKVFSAVILGVNIMASAYADPICTAAAGLAVKPSSNYTVDHNGTAIDIATGLMWQVCSYGQTFSADACSNNVPAATAVTWKTAMAAPGIVNAASSSVNAGYTDWRVPNTNELATLVDFSCTTGPMINREVFPQMPATTPLYWSSTPYSVSGSAQSAWYVRFDTGVNATTTKDTSSTRYVRLVRGPLPGFQ